jgi:hypothetical protein
VDKILAILSAAGLFGTVLMGILYARAAREAAYVEQLRPMIEALKVALKVARDAVALKEDYIRELEKHVLGSLPAGELANRLNKLFASNRSRAAGTVPPPKPPTKPSKP